MTLTTWIEDTDRIALKRTSGEVILPVAMEIFQAAFGRAKSWRGETVRSPLEDLPNLTFSRQPASPAVRVFVTEGGAIISSFGVATKAGFAAIEVEVDQVIHYAHWYPIRLDRQEQALRWLNSIGIHLGQEVTVGALVALRARIDKPFIVFDEVNFTPSAIKPIEHKEGEIPGFTGTLYPYQASGVAFLTLVADQGVGCILGDEMGLGKTAQVIALLQIEKNAERGPALVVTPATLLENWKRELAIFAPTLSVLMHAGTERGGVSARLIGFDVVLVSYDTAIRDQELLNQVPWNVVALDEAQAIKNPEALRTNAVKRLPRRVSIAVTGTPLENRIDDLWSLADFALPGLLGDRDTFQAEFGNLLADAARLAPVVSPLLLRRKVLEVAHDLPERIEVPQALQMSPRLANAYEALRKQTIEEFGPAGGLVATTRLRMLCAHPSLVGDWYSDPCMEMPKYARAVELLDEIFSIGEKVLVFSTYQAVADLFMNDMPKRFPDGFFRFIDGRTESPERQAIVDSFFAHRGYGALFLNPKAAGSGLNITAANHVIHYNPEWNPALTAQASARSYRKKQTRPVTIHHLFYVQTIEEVIRGVAAFKQELAGEAVTGHDGGSDPLAIAHALQTSPLNYCGDD